MGSSTSILYVQSLFPAAARPTARSCRDEEDNSRIHPDTAAPHKFIKPDHSYRIPFFDYYRIRNIRIHQRPWVARIIAYLRHLILQFLHRRAKLDALTGFKVLPVTIVTLGTYFLIWGYILHLDGTVPDVVSLAEQESWGVSVEEAYADLVALTKKSHPYNSAQIDVVGRWLVARLEQIIGEGEGEGMGERGSGGVELFGDDVTGVGLNATWVRPSDGIAVYFEGRNIMVYIHGTDMGLSPALVNAHYDSVSTSHGVSDDGVGVVTILQLIKSLTRSGSRPQRGLILLMNCGEEDGLNGARAFGTHSLSGLPRGGTGGRAILFRANDTAVNGFYQKVPRPLGSTFLTDAYKLGALKSATDYDIFRDALHMRGLDVAFYMHRSRYHTPDDDMPYASKRSISHMLLTALYTVNAMTTDTSLDYNENRPGKPAVYFDFFNRIWTFYELNTLFAWSLTLLIVPAIALSIAISCLGGFPGWKKARGWAFAEVSPEVGAGGGYFMMALYVGAFLGCCISLYELFIVRDKGGFKNDLQEGEINTSASNESPDLQQANLQTVAQKIDGQNEEESWSALMPNWTWLAQFLLMAPMSVLFTLQVALLATATLKQTLCDGGDTTRAYIFLALISIFILLPLGPFLHRIWCSVALPVLLIFVTTGIYNLYAFPFTADARFKTQFIQSIDLTTSQNRVKLTGNTGIINSVILHLPSTFNNPVECGKEAPGTPLSGLVHCTWTGLAPNVTSDTSKVSSWVEHSIEKLADGKARIAFQGKNTRACRLFFDNKNVTSIDILDSPSRALARLFRSTDNFKEDEEVEVFKKGKELKRVVAGGLEGRIVCLWSDTNGDEIPAFNEVVTYLPPWAIVLGAAHGLVEGTVPFII
ncbi:uncharacterized protein H6S33_012265 [Morchella sextelata]|uniref:uncharacterized protein n=1 Tax=Morchella sextelata TaxID=1174677 RepID=UPI001D03803E|nr:uncharacterized protein H6S33_012265 [Morchella sextelata]KAH0609719.1 hypothetical protein H6S33_012265 [Morchella sextelata]